CALFFIFFQPEYDSNQSNNFNQKSVNTQNKDSRNSDQAKEITPNPNNELVKNDVGLVAKAGVKNKSLTDVVKTIFLKNPTDIGNIYKGQENLYGLILIERNTSCFAKRGDDFICICDTLLKIPSFKKN